MMKLFACALLFATTASAFKVQPKAEPLLKLRGGNALADVSVGTVNLVNAIYYGGYGVPLLVDGDKFFGPSGMMPYQNKDIEGPVGKFFSKVRKRDSNSRLPVSLPLFPRPLMMLTAGASSNLI